MIKMRNLNKKFDPKGIAGIHDLSFDLPLASITALIGPNGSGKSTLLKIVSNQLNPDQGTCSSTGKLINLATPEIDQNVLDYLISKVESEVDLEKKIQLARDMSMMFEFTSQLYKKTSQISSGQLQKVILASELINKPEFVLLDEPFTHLDPMTRKSILQDLFQYIRQAQISLFWVTHDVNEAMIFSDSIMVLNFGKIEQISSPQDLADKPKNLFVAQFIGYQNLVPIQKENSEWISPWGKFILASSVEDQDAILIIPIHAWVHDQKFSARIISQKINNLAIETTFEFNHKPYVARHAKMIDGTLALRPDWEQCFIIPL